MMPRAAQVAYAKTWAGYRAHHWYRPTLTLTVALHGPEASIDGKWISLCHKHGHAISHDTLVLAKYWIRYPAEWCEPCQTEQQQKIERYNREVAAS